MALGWMAWTWETGLFFGLIVLGLATLTALAIRRPESPRRDILGFATTRGDRFFVSLIGSAYIFVAWIRFGGAELWAPLAIAIAFGAAMFRYA